MMCMSLSTNLNPSFMARSLSALRSSVIGVRRLFDGFPEDRVVTGKDTTAHEPGDCLQLLERVKRQRRVPDHAGHALFVRVLLPVAGVAREDRKSTRLNSSHGYISYAVFCLKKNNRPHRRNRRHGASTCLTVLDRT